MTRLLGTDAQRCECLIEGSSKAKAAWRQAGQHPSGRCTMLVSLIQPAKPVQHAFHIRALNRALLKPCARTAVVTKPSRYPPGRYVNLLVSVSTWRSRGVPVGL